MDYLKGWRTLGFNILAATLMVLQTTDFTPLLPPKYLWLTGLITVVVNIALRTITNTPIGKSQ